MAGFKGREVEASWKGLSLGGVRQKGLALNGEPINVTTDEDLGWQTLLSVSAEDQVTITVSGLTKDHRLLHDWINRVRTGAFSLDFPDGAVLGGQFFLAAYNETMPYNDATAFDATFASTGVVNVIPYS